MSDLTERLAAKLTAKIIDTLGWVGCKTPDGEEYLVLAEAPDWLPILLSEPELVAGLAPEARLSVLTKRERAMLRHGEAAYAHSVLLRERWNDFDALEKSDEEIRSSLRVLQKLAHAADLTTNPVTPEFDL